MGMGHYHQLLPVSYSVHVISHYRKNDSRVDWVLGVIQSRSSLYILVLQTLVLL